MTVRRLALLAIPLAVLVAIVLRYFVYVDRGEGCFITIRPSYVDFNNATMNRALEILKYASPADYRNVCTHVGTINPNPSCGGFGGGCFWAHEAQRGGHATIDVSTENGALLWTVAVIVHETCHAMQFDQRRVMSQDECYRENDRILRTLVQFE